MSIKNEQIKLVAMVLASQEYQQMPDDATDKLSFEDAGLYAAQNWDAHTINAFEILSALKQHE